MLLSPPPRMRSRRFTQPLMGKVFPLVQSRSRHVREQAITAIAVVAGCIEEHFVPYYQHIIPHLKQVRTRMYIC